MWSLLCAVALAAPGWITTGADPDEQRAHRIEAVPDLTGDGVDDLLVQAYTPAGDLELELWAGAAGGVPALFGTWSVGWASHYYAFATDVAVGDFDGDGDRDLAIGNANTGFAVSIADAPGLVAVYDGGPGGPAAAPTWTASGAPSERFGYRLVAADVDADGYDDLVFSDVVDPAFVPQRVRIAYGSAAGLGVPVIWRDDASGAHDLVAVHAAGDVDGDGFGDLVVEARLAFGGGDELVEVWSAAPGGPVLLTQYVVFAAMFGGTTFLASGDVTGDGYDDVLLSYCDKSGGPASSIVSLYPGSPTGPAAVAGWTYTTLAIDAACVTTGSIGDVDGDGFADIAIGLPYAAKGEYGRVRTFTGGPAGGTVLGRYTGTVKLGSFGAWVDLSGDLDGDGLHDLAIGWPGWEPAGAAAGTDRGRGFLLYGPL